MTQHNHNDAIPLGPRSYHGLYARVARRLGCHPNWVYLVRTGRGTSARVAEAIGEEMRIMDTERAAKNAEKEPNNA